ncbi:MAG: ABC transporter permease subunit [Firmicutes bacterium]|nr:ABC transporter permease subunit [Bacillota bacterium]
MDATATITKKGRAVKKHIWREVKKFKHIYIILAPTLLFYIVFRYAPMFGNVIAFQRFSITKGILGSKFVGLQNFKDFLTNYKFWELLRNTLNINFLGLVFAFPAPIILALLLNEVKRLRFKKTVQTITYVPHFISTVVVSSMILTFVASDGMINAIRQMFGGEKISFMTNSQYFYPIYIISDIWQHIGWGSIIYIAALSSVDQELYQAATIDGAGRWKQLLHVTLPGISQTIIILLIMRIGQMLSVGFEKIMLLYNPAIYETADVISTYVYRRGLLEGDYSFSAAVGMFNSIINFILLIAANFFSKKISDSGIW